MTVSRLYLVRHGETDWNQAGRIQGHHPTSLNETGRRQAEILARFFAPCPLTAVWSSDLPRAVETAARIAAPHQLTVRTMASLRERDLAPLEGMTGDEVTAALSAGDFSTWYDMPGVESDEAVLARVLPVLAEARKIAGEVVLATHGGVLKTVLYHLLGIPVTNRRAFVLSNGLVVALIPEDENWRVAGLYGLEMMDRS